jgi:tetratricopeptide (TPR) repeat protein
MAGPTPSIEKLQKKLEKEPNPLIYLQLAEEYRKERMYQEALKTCQDGLKRHPNYWSARVSMGRIHYELGDRESAREELEKVIKAVPDNLLANKLLGDIYRESGKNEDALKRYHLVQMLTPADAEVAASIRKIEEQIQSGSVVVSTELTPDTEELPMPVPQIVKSPETEKMESPLSAPTEILSREALKAALPPEAEPLQTVKIQDMHPRQFTPATFLDGMRTKERTQDEEDEVIELTEDSEKANEVDELNTQTLAEIYIQQGLPDKAIKVYQKLLLKDPGNEEITQRLRDLNPADVLLSSAAREEPIRAPEPRLPQPESIRRRPAEFMTDEKRRKISTLENWLAAIRRERA